MGLRMYGVINLVCRRDFLDCLKMRGGGGGGGGLGEKGRGVFEEILAKKSGRCFLKGGLITQCALCSAL